MEVIMINFRKLFNKGCDAEKKERDIKEKENAGKLRAGNL
jgi:hypothetical protein